MDGQRRLIRKIGNAVLLRRPDGKLWLVFVTVTMGGWAGSSLNLSVSRDGGYNWTPPKRIHSAPFLNLSTLVKGPAVPMEGGLVGLPVYQEFFGKFAEMLVLDATGRVVGKARMSAGRKALQPVVLPLDRNRAVAFARSGARRSPAVWRFESADGGRNWSAPKALDLANPNAAIAALRLPGGRVLIVFNDTPWKKRHNLKMAVSGDDGRNWRVIHTLENDADESARYSYPWLLRGSDGQYHLFYTWKAGAGLRHVRFNDAWLESR
jgi:predicted neuraminidase